MIGGAETTLVVRLQDGRIEPRLRALTHALSRDVSKLAD